MRYKVLFTFLFSVFSQSALAHWEKINDLDYTWGPFKIYNITLFTENGQYQPHTRPLMLSLKYDKPVDGRDFAISIARSWASLDIKVPEQNKVIERLRKLLPDLKSGDLLSYIALEDRGYFVVNDQIIPEEFDQAVNDAIVAVWLDPRVELSQKITVKKIDNEQAIHIAQYTIQEFYDEKESKRTATEQFQLVALNLSQFSEKILQHPAIGVPTKAITENAPKSLATEISMKANTTAEVPSQAEEQAPQATIVEPTTKSIADDQDSAKPEIEKPTEPKVDPENPEIEIRPIEDPMPQNKRAS